MHTIVCCFETIRLGYEWDRWVSSRKLDGFTFWDTHVQIRFLFQWRRNFIFGCRVVKDSFREPVFDEEFAKKTFQSDRKALRRIVWIFLKVNDFSSLSDLLSVAGFSPWKRVVIKLKRWYLRSAWWTKSEYVW